MNGKLPRRAEPLSSLELEPLLLFRLGATSSRLQLDALAYENSKQLPPPTTENGARIGSYDHLFPLLLQ